MEKEATSTDLERRKKIRVRLRGDLSFTTQKYEGRTYYVAKDPVSLRYYRFKEHERFLLDLMDGDTTLDEAQKRFEKEFRPERLTLEDLEAFATQLLNAGLAQNESPQAGKQLYDRFKKRRRSTALGYLLNIMYIKIPLYDPERVLQRMVKPLRFIFTTWFLVASVVVMLTALGLVLVQWDTFTSKLPSAQQFFSFNTLIYVWVALGAVKVIHEFGHGLSCKAFGGEVHEMGFLLLVFSPCLYCNVSDAWTLPSKWQRIIIGAAGIYVELIIASFATFLWWFTDSGTFVNNMCMSLMVVCSVSTIVFNANPLMRFDGYYILADWLEIPNLRDRSNKFLRTMVMEHCLGIEVPPEPYMSLTRQVLFILYAVISYVYRWVITFVILYFMYTFLQPYKLGILSHLLGTAALSTMIGWPVYRLIKGLKKRGRIPDMKPVRVWTSVGLLASVLAVLLFIPFPVRVRGLAVIEVKPEHAVKVVVPESGGFVEEIYKEDGARVKQGDMLVRLRNPDLDMELNANIKDQRFRRDQQNALRTVLDKGTRESRINTELDSVGIQLDVLARNYNERKKQAERLTMRAPRDGVVMGMPKKEDKGKWLEKGTLVCQVGDERALRTKFLVEPADLKLVANGNKAWIRVHGRGYNFARGTVRDISTVEAKQIPPQLSNRAGGEIPTQEDPQSRMETPQQQHYMIAVDFDAPDPTAHPGAMARVKIEAEPRTLWWRFGHMMDSTFNWRLWF